jgi:hypothetical protein
MAPMASATISLSSKLLEVVRYICAYSVNTPYKITITINNSKPNSLEGCSAFKLKAVSTANKKICTNLSNSGIRLNRLDFGKALPGITNSTVVSTSHMRVIHFHCRELIFTGIIIQNNNQRKGRICSRFVPITCLRLSFCCRS